MKAKLMICWRFFPKYREDIIKELSSKFEIHYYYGENTRYDRVSSSTDHEGILTHIHKVFSLFGECLYFDLDFYRELTCFKPSYVILQPTPRDLSIWWKIFLCRLFKVKVIGWGMGKMPGRHHKRQRLHDFFVSILIKRLDKMICYSTTAESYYNKLAPNLKLDVVVNTKSVKDESPEESVVTKNLSVIDIVFVGRLIASKKIDNLVRSAALLNEESNKQTFRLHILGDGAELDSLKELSDKLSVTTHFYGFKSGSDMYDVMRQCDLFVLPSLGGLSIIDAMYCGLPLVTGPADGTENDLVIDGYNGLKLRDSEPLSIARGVKDILSTDLLKLGNNSKTLYEERFTLDTFIRKFTVAIENTL